MPISVKQQVALGVTGTAVVATGGTLIYKNINSKTGEQETESAIISQPETPQDQNVVQPPTIEQLAIDKESWNIDQPSKAISSNPEAWKVTVSVPVKDSENWKCEILASSASSTVSDDDKTTLRKNLDSYFLGYFSATSTKSLKVEKPNRELFVKKCSEARTQDSQNSTDIPQVKVSLSTLVKDLKTIFGEIPLLQPEKDALSDDNWTVTSSNSHSGTSKKFTIKVENSTKSWTCSLLASATADSISFDGIKQDLKDKLNVDAKENGSATASSIESNNKDAFVKSCARNRKGSVGVDATKVESELNLSLNGHSDTYKFEASSWQKIFESNNN